MQEAIVIVGGGHAAAQLCISLQELSLSNKVHLVCGEAYLPYQRPPLSKGFLKSLDETTQQIRSDERFEASGVILHKNRRAIRIDRIERTILLDDGQKLTYRTLVLATGTRARWLPQVPHDVTNALTLRTAADAIVLRERLSTARHLVVLGGGFIGLEVAATARSLGKTVTVLEMAPRLMGRSASPDLSRFVFSMHVNQGTDIRLGSSIHCFECKDGRIVAVHLASGLVPCDLLLIAIGAQPEVELAQEACLACDNGVLVNSDMSTSDPNIYAIGDCASFLNLNGSRSRLESIQNANDQARVLAARLAGQNVAYSPVPWFWSEQGDLRLQMVGTLPMQPKTFHRSGASQMSFSLFHFDGERLACVESVNAPIDHIVSRKWLEVGLSPAPEDVLDSSRSIKTLLTQ